MAEVADWDLGWKQSKLQWEESCRKMKEVAEQLTISLGQTVEELKKLREEREALDSEIAEESEELSSQPNFSKTDTETGSECLKIPNSSQEFTTEHPFSGEFSMELIPFSDRRSNFDVLTVGTWHEFSEKMADFGKFSMSFLESLGAYQMFEEMPLRNFSISDSRIHMFLGNWVFDPGDFIDPEIAKRSCFDFQEILLMEIILANGNKADSKASSWEMSCNIVVGEILCYVIRIPVVFWNQSGEILDWNCCAGIFNYARAKGVPHRMPFDRGRSPSLHSYLLCKHFS